MVLYITYILFGTHPREAENVTKKSGDKSNQLIFGGKRKISDILYLTIILVI